MADNSNTGLIIGVSVLGVTTMGVILYLILKPSSSTASGAVYTPQQLAQMTPQQLSQIKAAQTSSASPIAGLATALVGLVKPTAKKVTPKAGTTSAGVPMTTVDSNGNYIEKADPTTLYDKNGNVVGSLNNDTGMFVNNNGDVIATADGAPTSQYDYNTGAYFQDGVWLDKSGNETQDPHNDQAIISQDWTANNYDPYNESNLMNLDTTTPSTDLLGQISGGSDYNSGLDVGFAGVKNSKW